MRIPYCSFMSFSTSWAEGDTILYGVNVNKRYRLRVASALKKRRHRNKIHFEAYFITRARSGNPFWGHTISYRNPSMWLNVFIPVNPHFPFFCFVNSAFLDPLIQTQVTTGLILPQHVNNPCLVTLTCFLYRRVSIFFPSPSPSSTLPFSSRFRTHPVSHNPSL